MTTGIGGWRAEAPPTVELTLAMGLWNSGGEGKVTCRAAPIDQFVLTHTGSCPPVATLGS